MDEIIKIQLFDNFIIEYKGESLNIKALATKQMVSLLEILIYHHRHPIPKEQLIDQLWQDNENPQNAMKYSIFRLRAFLKEIPCLADLDLISTTKNGYKFGNDHIEIISDFDMVEDTWLEIRDTHNTKQVIYENACKVLELYQGPFYMNTDQLWAMQIRTYYQNIYEKAFAIVCDQLFNNEEYDTVINITQNAIKLDEFYDDAYVYYIKALMEKKEFNRAIHLYRNVQTRYQDEFGNMPSFKLKSLYNILIKHEEEIIDVDTLKNKLNENIQQEGAFFCEYEFFKYIYHVNLRNAIRDKKKEFLIIFQLDTKEDDKNLSVFMSKLQKVCAESLRRGDVYSKINKMQIIILLPCQSIDNGYVIIQRITSSFYRQVNKNKARLHYFISSLNEFEENKTEK